MNSWDLTPNKHDLMEEIHSGREQYSAQFSFDLKRIFADLHDREKHNPAPRASLQPLKPKLENPEQRKPPHT